MVSFSKASFAIVHTSSRGICLQSAATTIVRWTMPLYTLLQAKLLDGNNACESVNRLSCSIQFTPLANDIKHLILQHWHLVQLVPGCLIHPLWVSRKWLPWKIIWSDMTQLIWSDMTQPPTFSIVRNVATLNARNIASVIRCLSYNSLFILRAHQGWFLITVHFAINGTSLYIILYPCNKYEDISTHVLKIWSMKHKSRIRNKNLEAPLVFHFWRQVIVLKILGFLLFINFIHITLIW